MPTVTENTNAVSMDAAVPASAPLHPATTPPPSYPPLHIPSEVYSKYYLDIINELQFYVLRRIYALFRRTTTKDR